MNGIDNREKLKNNLDKLIKIIQDFTQQVENTMPASKKTQVVSGVGVSAKNSPRGEYFREFINSFINKLKDKKEKEMTAGEISSFCGLMENYPCWVADEGDCSANLTSKFSEVKNYLEYVTTSTAIGVPNWTDPIKSNWQNLFQKIGLKFPEEIWNSKKNKAYPLARSVIKRYLIENMLTSPEDNSDSWENQLKKYLTENIFPRLESLDFDLTLEGKNINGETETYRLSKSKVAANLKSKFTNLFNWVTRNETGREVENEWLKNKVSEFEDFLINKLGTTKWNKKEDLKNFCIEAWEVRKMIKELGLEAFFCSQQKQLIEALKKKGGTGNIFSMVEFQSGEEQEKVLKGESDKLDFFLQLPIIHREFDKIYDKTGNSYFYSAELRLETTSENNETPKNDNDETNDKNKENSEQDTNQKPPKNTNDNENKPENTNNGKDKTKNTPTSEQLDQDAEKENQQKSAEKGAEIDNALKNFSTAGDIDSKLRELKTAEKNAEDQSYQKKSAEIKTSWEKVITENWEKSVSSIIEILTEQMKINEITETELDSETQQKLTNLKNKKVQESEKIITTKQNISQKIGGLGAEKRFSKLADKVKKAVKLGEKTEKEKVLKELVSFLKSTNIYDKKLISRKQNDLKKMRQDLENQGQQKSGQEPQKRKFPWKIVVPAVLTGVVVLTGLVVVLKRKKQIKQKPVRKMKTDS